MSKDVVKPQEPESGAVNPGINKLPETKYTSTQKALIISGIIVVIIITLMIVL